MSFESTLQRVNELQAMVDPRPSTMPAPLATGSDPTRPFANELSRALASGPATPAATRQPGPGSAYPVPTPYLAGPGAAWGVSGMVGPYGFGTPGAGPRMLAIAQGEVGVAEYPPGSNDGERIRLYRSATQGAENTPGPWCAYFVSWLASAAGAPVGPGGAGTGYVPTLESWARERGALLDPATPPQPGDIILFQRDGVGGSDHVGIVERVDADGTIHTIEGNSSNRVARRSYAAGTSQISGFIRV